MAFQIALNTCIRAAEPQSVLYFTLEMTGRDLMGRAVSNLAGLSHTRLASGDVDESDWEEIAKSSSAFLSAPMTVMESSRWTPSSITREAIAFARSRAAEGQPPLGLVVIDRVGLIGSDPGHEREDERTKITRATNEAKRLAKDLGCPVMLLAQVNREGETGPEGRMPSLRHLKSSGSIEEDSDVVLMLHRPDLADPDTARIGEMDIVIAKTRKAARGTIVPVAYQGHMQRIAPLARWDEPAA